LKKKSEVKVDAKNEKKNKPIAKISKKVDNIQAKEISPQHDKEEKTEKLDEKTKKLYQNQLNEALSGAGEDKVQIPKSDNPAQKKVVDIKKTEKSEEKDAGTKKVAATAKDVKSISKKIE